MSKPKADRQQPQNDELEKLMRTGTNQPPKTSPPADPILPLFKGETGIIVGTGPSLSNEQLDLVNSAKLFGDARVFAINNSFEKVEATDVQLSCDGPWWRYYWPRWKELRELPAMKFTWYPEIAKNFGIKYIRAIVKEGLSTDPGIVHINHGSGPMIINLALHFGISRLLLIGHDMKFAPDYDGLKRKAGSSPRHYFGEYPKQLQHWPSVKVRQGVLNGLITSYDSIQNDIQKRNIDLEIINCTPGSALTSFPISTLEKELG